MKFLILALAAPVAAISNTIRIDFGSVATSLAGWNNFATGNVSQSNLALVDSSGALTSVTLSYGAFTDAFASGTASPVGIDYPATATQDGFYSYSQAAGAFTAPKSSVTLTIGGLDPQLAYTFTYFASRAGVSDNRETTFSLGNGATSSVVNLDAANNSSQTVSSTALTPGIDGTLTLVVSAGTANTNANRFYYLNVLEISSSAIPEPGSWAALTGLVALGVVQLRRRGRAA